MKPRRFDAVLFDCDGLLADTETLCMQVAAVVCEEHAIPVSQDEIRAFIGVTGEKWFRELVQSKQSPHDAAALLARHFALYEKRLETDIVAFPGAAELPHALREEHYGTAVVSGSTRKQVGMILRKLGIEAAFQETVTYEDVGRHGKPDPRGYLVAAERLRVEPARCIALEDAVEGIFAAKAAGMAVIGVENAGMQDIRPVATNTVRSLADLLRVPVDDWPVFRR